MKPACLFILLISISSQHLFASDTTYRKTPWQITIYGGFNNSRVSGSMVQFIQTFSHDFNITGPDQQDGGGLFANVAIQKDFAEYFYVKSGLGFIHKQVNPEEKAYPLYKDSLNTNYLNIPLLVGAQGPLNQKKTIFIFFETGVAGNFKLSDKTYSGPDRVAFETKPFIINYQASTGFNFYIGQNTFLLLQYTYSVDLTNAYKETLYLGATDLTYFVGYYKWNTSSISLGIQWSL